MIQFVLWEPNEEQERLSREYWTDEAWRLWIAASCEERNNGHHWVLECIVEEEHMPSLYCEYCPIDLGDIFIQDYTDLLQGQLGEVTIIDGRHNSKNDVIIPVNVKTHAERINSYFYGLDWELWVDLTLRGQPKPLVA